jgi:hypothetical protein
MDRKMIDHLFPTLAKMTNMNERDCVELFEVDQATAKAWLAGEVTPPEQTIVQLVNVVQNIEKMAETGLERILKVHAENGIMPDEIELGLANSEEEAKSLGWPFPGAQVACLSMIITRGSARGLKFKVVPRGSTPASKVAARAHDAARTLN